MGQMRSLARSLSPLAWASLNLVGPSQQLCARAYYYPLGEV